MLPVVFPGVSAYTCFQTGVNKHGVNEIDISEVPLCVTSPFMSLLCNSYALLTFEVTLWHSEDKKKVIS